MGVAARTMAFQRRLRHLPGPLSGASPLPGKPFLTDEFGPDARLLVEVAFGAVLSADVTTWSWIDVSADVRYESGLSISPIGRGDESSTAQPAGLKFVLDNESGDYTPYAPGSRWYPYVRRGTPVRVSINLGNGAGWFTRFEGRMNGWPPRWDISAEDATVPVSASGVLRRMMQGRSALKPALERALTFSAPRGLWLLADGGDATQAASGVTGGTPLAIVGDVLLGVEDAPAGAAAAVDIAVTSNVADGRLVGDAPAGGSATSWTVGVWRRVSASTTSAIASGNEWYTGDPTLYRWVIGTLDAPDVIVVNIFSSTGALSAIAPEVDGLNVHDGEWHHFAISAVQVGGNVQVTLTVDGTNTNTVSGAGTLAALAAQNVPQAGGSYLNVVSLGFSSLAVWDGVPDLASIYQAGLAWAGELADARMIRLCREERVQLQLTGASDTVMGRQAAATFVALLREVEACDAGVLADGLGPGLRYTTRAARYNQPAALTIDASAGQVGDPFEPDDDDQRTRNLAKVERQGGSSAVYEDIDGPLGTDAIGTYDTSLTVPYADDSPLLDRAAWLVYLGTLLGLRYPTLVLDLRARPELAAGWLAAGDNARVDVVEVAAAATQHPPGDVPLLVEGYGEQLNLDEWRVMANTSPYAYEVAELDASGNRGRLDLTQTLAVAVDGTETSWSLATPDGDPLLITTAAAPEDFPLDVDAGGERITITDISGGASPQTVTVTRSVNGVVLAHPAGTPVVLWLPGVIAL